MTNSNVIKTQHGPVSVEKYLWGEVWKGSKQALIESGIAGDGWFPGDPGNNKTSLRILFPDEETYTIVNNGRYRVPEGREYLSIRKERSKFVVWRSYSGGHQARIREDLDLKRALEEEQKKLNSLSANREEAREKILREAEVYLGMLHKHIFVSGVDGYELDSETQSSLLNGMGRITSILERSSPILNARRRAEIETSIRIQASRADTKFANFISDVANAEIPLEE